MKILKNTATLLGLLFLCLSCSEDHDCDEGLVELPNAIAPLLGVEYAQSLEDCRRPRVQTFTFQGFEGGTFLGAQSAQIIIAPQSIVNSDGTPVDQVITLELIEMYNPGEIIACQLSTNGLSTTNIPEPLLSEGIYYLNLTVATDPTVELTLLEAIQIFNPSDNDGLTGLRQFNSLSCQELECLVLWEPNLAAEVIPDTIEDPIGGEINGYRTFIFELGWVTIARYNPDDSLRTVIYNKAPNGYDKSNSNTFLRYESSSIGVSLFDSYNSSLSVFSEMHGQIPVNTVSNFILVTVQDGAYRFATQNATIGMEQIGVTTQTNNASESDFISAINNL